MHPFTSPDDSGLFQSRSYYAKLYSGKGALQALPKELAHHGVRRALLLCGRSVHEKTQFTQELATLLGDRLAGIFPGIPEGAPTHAIEAAAAEAERLQADGFIALGAGSVLKGARVVAMLLAEKKKLLEMSTVHRVGEPPISPRLMAPKAPIFNILTAPTTAQNRAGSALRYHGATAHQLEFFDPKTRPAAIFWDEAALATAPVSLMRSTGLEVYFLALMGAGAIETANPLVQALRRQNWELARQAMPRLGGGDDARARLDLCAAAYMINRDEDDGGRPLAVHPVMRTVYALSVALFNRCEGVTQSHGYAAFTGAAIRTMGPLCPERVAEMGRALGVQGGVDDPDFISRVGDAADRAYQALGWDTSLAGLGLDAARIDELTQFALRNFNANNDGLLTRHAALVRATLAMAAAGGAR